MGRVPLVVQAGDAMQVDTSLRRYAAASRSSTSPAVDGRARRPQRHGAPQAAARRVPVKIERRGNSYAAKIDRAAASRRPERLASPGRGASRATGRGASRRDEHNRRDGRRACAHQQGTHRGDTPPGGRRLPHHHKRAEDRFEDRPANDARRADATCMMPAEAPPAEAPPAEAPPAEAPPAENMFTVKISRQEGGGYSTTIRRS